MHIIRQTFVRPEVVNREKIHIPANVFNRCRLALNHSGTDCAFVPIRSMQFQAVVSRDEIIFVDNQAYRVQDDQGGRLIVLGWDLGDTEQRESISEPVAIEVIHFHVGLAKVQQRLMSEFPTALHRHEEIAKSREKRSEYAEVVLLRS